MKKKSLLYFILIITVMISSSAFGTSITFNDDAFYWPGWHNGQRSDDKDLIGVPDFTEGSVRIEGGVIKNISFNYINFNNPILGPGDLFIDVGADKNWDYFINIFGQKSPGNYNLFKLNIPFSQTKGINDNYYRLSGKDNTSHWRGYNIRDDHPIGVDLQNLPPDGYQLIGQVYFSGWPNYNGISIFEFNTSFPIIGNQGLILAWTVTCANDVVFEKIEPSGQHNPVPEPASIILLGYGLIGIATFGKRKFRRD